VTNALKHAFPGERPGVVDVRLTRGTGDQVELAVADDGVGLPDDLDPRSGATLGLDLVFTIATQLAADVELRRGPGLGYRFRFAAPVPAEGARS